MPRFSFSYRVPRDYRPGEKTGKAWQAWFESRGSSRTDTGYAVVVTRTLGKLDAQTRLGGYSVVTAKEIEAAPRWPADIPPSGSAAWNSAPFRRSAASRGGGTDA